MSHENFSVVDKAYVFILHDFMNDKLTQRSKQTKKADNLILIATIQYCFADAYESISYMFINLKYFHYYNLYQSLLYYIILLVNMRKTLNFKLIQQFKKVSEEAKMFL